MTVGIGVRKLSGHDIIKNHILPLLLIPGEKDSLIPIEAVKATYERAREPKAISMLPMTHYEAYREPWSIRTADLAIEWFQKYL